MNNLKKKKNNAFTLIEVMVVILLIGIIALIVTPNILKRIEESRKRAFLTDVKSALELAEANNSRNNFRNLSYTVSGNKVKDSNGNVLDSRGSDSIYGDIKFTLDGASYLAIHNNRWCAKKVAGLNKINIADFINGECEIQVIDRSSIMATGPRINGMINSTYKENITLVDFVDSKDSPGRELATYDVSDAQDKSVMAYVIPNESNPSTYTLQIGAQGGIIANENSSKLFLNFHNLVEVSNLNLLDTSNTTNMSYMFHGTDKLTNLDLQDLDMSLIDDDTLVSMFDANHLSYKNTEYTTCTNVECSLNELFERLG